MSEAAEESPTGRGTLFLGAPITYIPIWAAIIVVLSLIPLSPVVGGGGFFTLSMAVSPLVGVVLGPWAGALTALIGGYVSMAVAPYGAVLGPLEPIPRALEALVGGFVAHRRRRFTWLATAFGPALLVVFWASFPAVGMEFPRCPLPSPLSMFSPYAGFLFGATHVWPSWILLLATSGRVREWISHGDFKKLSTAMFIVTYYVSSSVGHVLGATLSLYLYRFPLVLYVYTALTVTWAERLVMAACGAVMGAAAITAMRKAGAVKPLYTIW